MTDSTQRELRMLANRMLTQTEARNGYQGSPVCLLLRKDAEKAMALMTKAADLVDVLESSLRLQTEVAADANAQLNAMRELAGRLQAVVDAAKEQKPVANVGNSFFESWYSLYNPAGKSTKQTMREAYEAGMVDHEGRAPATLPLEIAGSLRPDDYVSPRLAAEAYRENE